MPEVIDVLRLLAPTLIAALPTWATMQLLSGRFSEPLSGKQRLVRSGLILLFFNLYGALAVLALNTVWSGGVSVGEWVRSSMPGMAISIFVVGGIGAGAKKPAKTAQG